MRKKTGKLRDKWRKLHGRAGEEKNWNWRGNHKSGGHGKAGRTEKGGKLREKWRTLHGRAKKGKKNWKRRGNHGISRENDMEELEKTAGTGKGRGNSRGKGEIYME